MTETMGAVVKRAIAALSCEGEFEWLARRSSGEQIDAALAILTEEGPDGSLVDPHDVQAQFSPFELATAAKALLTEVDAMKLDALHPAAVMATHLRDVLAPIKDSERSGLVAIFSDDLPMSRTSLADLFAKNLFSDDDLQALFRAFSDRSEFAVNVVTFGGGAAPLIAVKLYEPGDESKTLRDVLPFASQCYGLDA